MSPSSQWRHSVSCDNPSTFPGSRLPSQTAPLQQQVTDEVVRDLVENRKSLSGELECPSLSQNSQSSLEDVHEYAEVGFLHVVMYMHTFYFTGLYDVYFTTQTYIIIHSCIHTRTHTHTHTHTRTHTHT